VRCGPAPAAHNGRQIQGNRLMTETVLSSATREVVIGFERSFVALGDSGRTVVGIDNRCKRWMKRCRVAERAAAAA
jgi:hypothetical protein